MKTFCCILILQSKDGFRVHFADDANDIFWKLVQGTEIQYEERTGFTPEELKYFFGAETVIATKELAWQEAVQIYRDQSSVGKQFIKPNEIRWVIGHQNEEFQHECR